MTLTNLVHDKDEAENAIQDDEGSDDVGENRIKGFVAAEDASHNARCHKKRSFNVIPNGPNMGHSFVQFIFHKDSPWLSR